MEKYMLDVTINKEKLSDGSVIFVSHCPSLGIASQGSTIEEAQANIKEAVEIYLEEQPDKYEELTRNEAPLFYVIQVTKNAQTANTFG